MLRNALIIGFGGFFGTIARYLSSQLIFKIYPSSFPLATLAINVVGCFLIGVFFGVAEKVNFISLEWRMFLTIGFCGGFTTFSAFSLENVQLLNRGEWGYVMLYSTASVVVAILATYFGIWVMKTVL
ncbi:MAG: fluoride efflux transporter CrcB [Chitinophagales bacterium]|nr:fluoride efflux transporter CrcB [Chitinophagales bacterium]